MCHCISNIFTKLNWLIQGGHILAKMKFPVFSLCYIHFPCVIFTQKQLAQWIKATSLLYYYIQKHTNSFFKVGIIWLVSIVNFSKCLLIEGSRESCDPCNDQGFRTPKIWYVKIILCWAHFADIFKVCFFLKWIYAVKTILWNWLFFKKWIYVVKSNYFKMTPLHLHQFVSCFISQINIMHAYTET